MTKFFRFVKRQSVKEYINNQAKDKTTKKFICIFGKYYVRIKLRADV